MWILEEVLLKYGRFTELYHDRGSMYVTTTKASEGPKEEQNGQVTRALGELGIKQRWAYSPQARGRCERAFGTIQGRLCAELKTKKIEDYETANAYLQDVFIPDFNKRFTVKPERDESAFAPISMNKAALRVILSQQEKRQVKNDYTLQWHRQVLQLPKPKNHRVLVKKDVLVHQMHDGAIAVSHQNKILAYFKADSPWHQLEGFTKHEPLLARPLEPPPKKYKPKVPRLLDDHIESTEGHPITRHDLFHDPQLSAFT